LIATFFPFGRDRRRNLKILRRTLSNVDLSKGMGISPEELEREIRPLVKEGKLRVRVLGDSVYYEMAKGDESL
jgi:DNA-binding Lrp family transcriptional regulator